MSEELKPCPICGAYATIGRLIVQETEGYSLVFRVECSEGCISTVNVDSKEIAIKLWNDWVDEYE